MNRFNEFRNKVLGLSEKQENTQYKIDIRSYAKYLLKEGSLLEKHELLQSIKNKFILINKQAILEEV